MDECPGSPPPQALPVTKRVTNSEILDLLVTGESGLFLEIRLDVYITVFECKTFEYKDMCAWEVLYDGFVRSSSELRSLCQRM